MTVTFALSGLGEVYLDEVRICPVGPRSGPPMPLSMGLSLPGMAPPVPAPQAPPGKAVPIDRSRLAPLERPRPSGPPGR